MRRDVALNFPNSSRSYNSTKHCVCFRGYDSVFEVAFELDERALHRMSPNAVADEASVLAVFDMNRARIERAAAKSYARRRQAGLYSISPSDF
jgi:hypothetical protein